METKQEQITNASAYAAIVRECVRTNDYGGKYLQALARFFDEACAGYREGKPVFYSRTGHIVVSRAAALKSYGIQ